MRMLLDTCVLSEFVSKQPNVGVIRWLEEQDEDRLFISTITLGELQYGVARLPPSQRSERLTQWLASDILDRFGNRVLSIDAAIMLRWGTFRAQMEAIGRVLPTLDSVIATTALVHDLQVVTRNVQDFADAGVQVINPWQDTGK